MTSLANRWVGHFLTHGWKQRAACRPGMGVDPDVFFSNWTGPAMLICKGCPVRDDCLDHALTCRMAYGVWGGVSAAGRVELLRDLRDTRRAEKAGERK